MDFNPPIPCGMGLAAIDSAARAAKISIHPSRVGWDVSPEMMMQSAVPFQSTHPVWDGTEFNREHHHGAPYFNPPIPCGMGLGLPEDVQKDRQDFNPPIPCGMGPPQSHRRMRHNLISIHPSRVGWDLSGCTRTVGVMVFQSTHPVWDGTDKPPSYIIISHYFNPPIPCGMGPATWF